MLGVSEPNAWRRVPPPATADAIAAQVAALGATSQRFVVDWSLVEPQPPNGGHRYQFDAFDAMYRADLRNGIRPLLVVLNAPRWAWDPGTTSGTFVNYPPSASRIEDWQAFLGAVARRYPRALGIEIWNEPNLATFWGGASDVVQPDPLRYTSLLSASYGAVKSANPRLLVIGGALAADQVEPAPGDLRPYDFAEAMFQAGAAAYMDAISLHPYPGSGGVAQTLALIEQLRQARDEVGARTPLWLTEIGVTTTGPAAVSEAQQAGELTAVCEAASREPGVEAVYVHNLIELERPHAGPDAGFGLIQPLGTGALRPKPALAALRQAFSAPSGCAGEG